MILNKNIYVILLVFIGYLSPICAQNKVTIKGSVKFIDEDFKMTLFVREGTSKKILGQTKVNDNHTYSITVPVDEAGEAVLDCGKWQSVNIWLDDENLEIDFRGMDTARIKIKNPPFVYIKGGIKNELMNLINFQTYRNYQSIIAYSQISYRANIENDEEKQKLASLLYDYNNENYIENIKYIIRNYADRNSVIAALNRIDYSENKSLVDSAFVTLVNSSPNSFALIEKYKDKYKRQIEYKERMNIGIPAPFFTFITPDGEKSSIKDFNGKILVLDFWASWCGPCRQEIPNMKEIYNDFNDKNIEFLSISIDEKKNEWKKALGEENMPWKQGWTDDAGKEVMEQYRISGIPFILVLDENGKILAKNLRGKKIREALQNILNGESIDQPKKSITMGVMM